MTLTLQRLEWIVGGRQAQQGHFDHVQFVVQCGGIVVSVHIVVAKVFAREMLVKLADRATLQHLVNVVLFPAVAQDVVPADRGAEAAGQVAAHHVVQSRLLDRRGALVHVPWH